MASSSQGRLAFKMNKTCDQCRHRKIRCIVPDTPSGTPPTCIYCTKRGQPCHFSIFRRKVRIRVPDSFSSHSQYPGELAPDELLVDRLLQYGPQSVILPDETSVLTAPDEQVLSSGLAFFSEQKVTSLTQKIGNTRLQDIVKKLDDYIASRLGLTDEPIWPPINFDKPEQKDRPTPNETRSYIQAYFINLHPVYPFLDQEEFESQAFSPNLDELLKQSPAFSALYHSILALGSQYLQFGTFEPGNGRSWEYFQVALGHMSDIILPRESIESVQALAAMSIFSMNLCGLQISDSLISQAARMVVTLRYHKDIVSEPKHLRVFWVIYALEKQQAIHGRTCSLIPDEDIACVVPPFPEAQVGSFNWFVAFIRIGRISSIVYNSLFSISASLRSKESYQIAMSHIRRILEDWRQSIPADYRPGDSASFPASPTTVSISLIALQVHYSYYHIIIALERLTLHLELEQGDKGQMSKQRLMNTARTIIELTKHIDVQPYVPIFILTVLPLAAVFILFDFVIHNPYHRESRTNLSLLDSAAGYFSLVSLASDRAMPSTIMSEFAEIAREYYWKSQQAKLQSSQMPMDPPSLPVTMMPEESTATQGMDQLPQQQVFAAPDGAIQMDVSASTSIPGTDYIPEPQISTPGPSEYLNYPTPMNFEAASDFQTAESGDLRSMFGWVYPEWAVGGIDLDSLNLEQPEFNGEGL
ncbi:unnamed protein product [Clonostachys rosea f. rosea IK726]|uniref:Uncharacterized protein n=1 Tax=Clonostachys rosea f. rosea IK726 TaxID=1349383 RepID=A0ACA9UG30_BIOOC|nr:unnamed protein product [Clonostachys rosea f. rosea IK726]